MEVPAAGAALVATLENVLFALLPRAVMAVMHTTMISASMTAYSTAVGPSSRFRKFVTFSMNFRMIFEPFRESDQETAEHSDRRSAAQEPTAALRATLLKTLFELLPRA